MPGLLNGWDQAFRLKRADWIRALVEMLDLTQIRILQL